MIKINSLNKYFNKGRRNQIHVINDVNVSFDTKGLNVILGKSGSGKTTLLNVIGGLDSFSGSISYDEETFDSYKMSRMDEFRNKNIGYIFQNYLLIEDISVFDNIDLALEIYGISSREEREKRIVSSLDAVGMKKYRRRLASALSGGQKQRVGIARALAKLPSIIIADEPTGNLDSQNSIEIMRILKSLSKERLVLLVTHSESLASSFGDRIIEYSDGCIVKDIINKQQGYTSLEEKNIYIGDLNKEEINDSHIKGDFISDTPNKDINLRVLEYKGKTYLFFKENYIINPNINLIEGTRPTEVADTDSLFDHSNFENVPLKSPSLKDIFATSVANNFSKKKIREKFYEFICNLIGLAVAILVIVLGNISNMQYYQLATIRDTYDLNSVLVPIEYKDNEVDNFVLDLNRPYFDFKTFKDESGISEFVYSNDLHQTFSSANFEVFGLNSGNNAFSLGRTVFVYPNQFEENFIDSSLLTGRLPSSKNEVAIDKSIIDTVSNFGVSTNYDEVLNTNILINDLNGYDKLLFKITGVTDCGYKYICATNGYGPELVNWQLNNTYGYYNRNIYYDFKPYYLYLNGTGEGEFDISSEHVYEVSPIRDEEKINVYCRSSDVSALTNLISNFGYKINILGYMSEYYYSIIVFDQQSDIDRYAKEIFTADSMTSDRLKNIESSNIELVNGTMPENENEILVSSIFGSSAVGKTLTYGTSVGKPFILKVVGEYNSSLNDNPIIMYTTKSTIETNVLRSSGWNYFISLNGDEAYYRSKMCRTSDFERTRQYFLTKYNKVITLAEPTIMQSFKNEGIVALSAIYYTLVGLAFTLVVFSLLSARSNLIKYNYKMSVYRCIGAKKSFIYQLFVSDKIVFSLKTYVPVYLLVFVIYFIIATMASLYMISFPYFILGLLGILVSSLIGTILTLFVYLRKSPAELISKFDI